jgi:Uma2 family endonuclease
MLLPHQGEWTEEDYLALNSSRLVEFSDGCLEVLSTPTRWHQFIMRYLLRRIEAYLEAHPGGEVLPAPLPIHLWPGKYREPDTVYSSADRVRNNPPYPEGADLAMEVVSEGEEDRKRDLVTKRQEYAAAGITEYWIVDPQEQQITVLTLDGPTYRVHGVFAPGERATSELLAGFVADVAEVFKAGQPPS